MEIKKRIDCWGWKQLIMPKEISDAISKFNSGDGVDIEMKRCYICDKETPHVIGFNEGGYNSVSFCLPCCADILKLTESPIFEEYFNAQRKLKTENDKRQKLTTVEREVFDKEYSRDCIK